MRSFVRWALPALAVLILVQGCAPPAGPDDEMVDSPAGEGGAGEGAGGAAGGNPGGAAGYDESGGAPGEDAGGTFGGQGGSAAAGPPVAGNGGQGPSEPDAGTGPTRADAGPKPDSGPPVPFTPTCTQILGGMPSDRWYEIDRISKTIAGPNFELQGNAGIRHWTTPDAEVWKGSAAGKCPSASGNPDQVWLIIWGHDNQAAPFWEEKTREAIAAIRKNRPGAKRILLSPEVGGPSCGQHYSGRNFNNIVAAIDRVVAGDVVAGPRVRVDDCKLYEGKFGTLTEEGARQAARGMGEAVRPFN